MTPVGVFFCWQGGAERDFVNSTKMNQLGTRNFGAYARKMLINGYIIKVDYTEQKKLAAAVSRIATNINHVCHRINSTGHFYDADVAELKERMADVWEMLKAQQRNEL